MIDKSVCIYDSGFFVDVAVRMVKEFKKVYYFCPWESGYSKYRDYRIGTGIEGVERVKYFWDIEDKVDLFIFTDCCFPSEQAKLRRDGKLVWGFAHTAWLENDRMALREWQEDQGMDVPETEEFLGLDEAEENIKEGYYLKISQFRGDMETLKHYNYKCSEQFFDEQRVILGAGNETMPFQAEKEIKGSEPGYDNITINGEHPKKILCGYEKKDEGYVAKWINYENLPPQLKKVDKKLMEVFKTEQTKGSYSTEIIVPNTKDGYLLDFTARQGNPPYQLFLSMVENLGEIYYNGAQGIVVEPKLKAKWGVIAIMDSEAVKTTDLPFLIDEKVKDFVFIMNRSDQNGITYSIPQHNLSECGSVAGMGDTLDEAIAHCQKNAEGVIAYQLKIFTDCFDKLKEKVFEGRQKNIIL